jgi:hypothetical protein
MLPISNGRSCIILTYHLIEESILPHSSLIVHCTASNDMWHVSLAVRRICVGGPVLVCFDAACGLTVGRLARVDTGGMHGGFNACVCGPCVL